MSPAYSAGGESGSEDSIPHWLLKKFVSSFEDNLLFVDGIELGNLMMSAQI